MHSVYLNYLLYIYLLSNYFSYFNSNTTGVTCGAETDDPTRTPKFTSAFYKKNNEDTKRVIRSGKSKKDRQYNGHRNKDKQYNGHK
jgi:hypothetical protein